MVSCPILHYASIRTNFIQIFFFLYNHWLIILLLLSFFPKGEIKEKNECSLLKLGVKGRDLLVVKVCHMLRRILMLMLKNFSGRIAFELYKRSEHGYEKETKNVNRTQWSLRLLKFQFCYASNRINVVIFAVRFSLLMHMI